MLIRTRLPLKNSKCSNERVNQAAVVGSCSGSVDLLYKNDYFF